MTGGDNIVGSVERSIEIVAAIQDLNGARVTELADHLDLPASTVHNHLATLSKHRFLVKEDGVYQIGLRYLELGGYARHRKLAYDLAFDIVDQLAEETAERAQFIVEEHGRGIYLHTAIGSNAVELDARIGKVTYLHSSAAGKAILSQLPRKRVDEILDRWGMTKFTGETIIDRSVLYADLEEIRERGYSFTEGEEFEGIRSVGVPVTCPDGTVLGGFSVSGPSNRMKYKLFRDEIPDMILGAANELELNITYA